MDYEITPEERAGDHAPPRVVTRPVAALALLGVAVFAIRLVAPVTGTWSTRLTIAATACVTTALVVLGRRVLAIQLRRIYGAIAYISKRIGK